MNPRLLTFTKEVRAAMPADIGSALLVVGAFLSEGKLALTPSAAAVDAEIDHLITAHFARGTFDAKPGTTLFLAATERFPGGIAVTGLGEIGCYSDEVYKDAIEKSVRAFSSWSPIQAYCINEWIPGEMKPKRAAALFAAAGLNSLTHRTAFKSKPDPESKTDVLLWIEDTPSAKVLEGLAEGRQTAEAMAIQRQLADLPGNICTPDFLAQAMQAEAENTPNLSVTVWDEAEIEKAGMGAFLSVAKGSAVPPRFIIMRYAGSKKNEAPAALVGKGITFDAGGISLKPAADMADMTYDMSGAAAVIGTVAAAARAGLRINLLGVVAACENLPSGTAAKPGDVVTSLSGKTIEILNTDCEGRMILADALTWTAREKPAFIIDAATLTGACCVALGSPYSGLFTTDKALGKALQKAGRDSLDEVWPMPVGKAYEKLMKSNTADVANQATTRDGGASSAAAFLSLFTENLPWAHLDIAATANTSGRERQSTGRPAALLMTFLQNRL